MSPTLDERINRLKHNIAELKSQREILGDETVEAALLPLQRKLVCLESQVEPDVETSQALPTRKRKMVTLLYLDVVGSTAMTQDLDPEDTMEILDKTILRLAAPIDAHGGHVTRFTGDGFKAIFGDPIAREDDPEQAIRAGLAILEESSEVAQEIEKEWSIEDFQVRIGIDTGLAAIGGQTEAEDTVKGRVVNLAVRIESAAPPGGLLISHNTYRHVRGVFNVVPQEPITAKGFSESVPVYLVQSIKPRAYRVHSLGVEGVETRMIGRKTELNTLKDALLTVIENGEGQIITLSGEAGVGKSRLLLEFQNWVELLPKSIFLYHSRGLQGSQGHPYSLLRNMFTFRFQILDDDSKEITRLKFEAGMRDVFGKDEKGTMQAHIIGQLLGFDFSTSPHLKGVLNDAEQLRNRSLMYLRDYFLTLSEENPILIMFEDIHWGDSSSLDAIKWLEERISQLSLIIVCAARHSLFEKRPDWIESNTNHHQLKLSPLSEKESSQLIYEILQLVESVPDELHELLITRSDGNPFYLEEMIKMLIEDGVVISGDDSWQIEAGLIKGVDVPPTLMGVLQARLERLPTRERTILQQASVVGRLFWDQAIYFIQSKGDSRKKSQLIPIALSSLLEREFIYERDESAFVGSMEYIFKHDVLRDVIYESVIKRLRKTYHDLVAEWLISNRGDRIDELNGLIADHLLQAGKNEQASEYFYQAGKSALAAYANLEAEGFFRIALELSLPAQMEANVLEGLGDSLYRRGNLGEASQSLRTAIELNHELSNYDQIGIIYAKLSRLLLQDYQSESWELCLEGLRRLNGAPDSPGYAQLLAEAGRAAYFTRKHDQIVPLCKAAVEMALRLDDIEVYIDANLTITFQAEDKFEVISILKDMIELAEENDLYRTAARAHHNLSINLETVDLNSALQHSIRAAEIFQRIAEVDSMMHTLRQLALNYTNLGKFNSLEDYLLRFLKSSTIPKARERGFWNLINMFLFSCKGKWKSGLEFAHKLVEEYRKNGNHEMVGYTNTFLIWINLEMNWFGKRDDLSEAIKAAQENLDINPKNERASLSMAIIMARLDQTEDAKDWLTKSIDIHGHVQNNSYFKQFQTFVEFEITFAEKKWTDALIASELSSEMLLNSGQHFDWSRKLIDIGDVLTSRNEPGDKGRAKETYQQSLDMFTEMGAPGYIEVLEDRLMELQQS